jgi:NADPH:quinone reductase-like Zn-dependent oxidoreductase
MKAWLYSSADGRLEKNIKYGKVPRPSKHLLGENEVLVEVQSMSLNPVDYLIPELGLPARVRLDNPAIPGLDFCGRVAAAHTNDPKMQVGQRVFGRLDKVSRYGTLGQYVIANLEGCIPVPAICDNDDNVDCFAALGTAALTAYQSIVPNFKQGKKPFRIFINGGTGGTGTWGIQIARVLRAEITTSCSSYSVAFCKQLGAHEVLDYRHQNIITTLKNKGPIFDLVIDNVGMPGELYYESEHFLKPTGKFIQVSEAAT